jgi:Holliday junction resolvase YEN1
VEKAMFYRICNPLTLNIELVFVSDGPDVIAKNGGMPGRKINYGELALLKNLLRNFGRPFLEAPGEAEAKCCHVQILGLVDAVWSQDSDCLMFSCELWLCDLRIPVEEGYNNNNLSHTKKAAKMVRVVQTDVLRRDRRLRREGCVLLAMLSGSDYDAGKGLWRCGAITALKAAQSGIGMNLCNAKSQADCKWWKGPGPDTLFQEGEYQHRGARVVSKI